jgi:Peptidase S46
MTKGLIPATCVLVLIGASASLADEGMWTFDNPPVKILKEKYGFTPTKQWLDHVRLASVRFNDGGSGSFVSPNGLVLTNHHVAAFQLQKMSTAGKDYVKDGFYAPKEADEMKTTDLEVNVLESMENVTHRVLAAVKPGMTEPQALKARQAEIANIEKESLDQTGLRSDVVSLYHGGEYWLYRYKRYTDVRLVFAPEKQAAFFGGDPDNFTYPRYDLDMALFRVYENGKPIRSPDYLRWDLKGAKAGELVFVSGNPGTTEREETMAQIETARDVRFPLLLQLLRHRLDVLNAYGRRGAEQAREVETTVFGIENSVKDIAGIEQGLQNPKLIAKKQQAEDAFRARIAANAEWQHEYGDAWSQIAEAQAKLRPMLPRLVYEQLSAPLARKALTIVQYVAEIQKPDGKRLPGYHDAQLPSLRFQMFSPAPVYPALEETQLADELEQSLKVLGPDNAFVKAVLDGRTPEEVAKAAISGTKLADPAFRKELVKGGEAAVQASTDPLIVLARKADPFSREVTKWDQDNIESVETPATAKIARARFAVYGKSTYPDATFTLRLAFGTVKGYPMNGTIAPPKTTLYGLYNRAYGFDLKPPFNLPERFLAREKSLNLSTPLDFVNTCDIIGGNSGSPVINREGELVGLIFDGNIESLISDYEYNEETGRAVAVHPAAMIEALRKLYDAGPLADEIEGKATPQ